MRFQNRFQAGTLLAESLKEYAGRDDVLLLALPRGGVTIAKPISELLDLPMDALLVKKLGVPGHEELAMGAIAVGGVRVLNKDIINELGISQARIDEVATEKEGLLAERNQLYRQNRPLPEMRNKTIIIVDDGIATGATMRAAIEVVKSQAPGKVIVAVPVADISICREVEKLVDEVICLSQPEYLMSIGYWYDDFTQVADQEVLNALTS